MDEIDLKVSVNPEELAEGLASSCEPDDVLMFLDILDEKMADVGWTVEAASRLAQWCMCEAYPDWEGEMVPIKTELGTVQVPLREVSKALSRASKSSAFYAFGQSLLPVSVGGRG